MMLFIFYVYHSGTQTARVTASNFDEAETIARKLYADVTNINKGACLYRGARR